MLLLLLLEMFGFGFSAGATAFKCDGPGSSHLHFGRSHESHIKQLSSREVCSSVCL